MRTCLWTAMIVATCLSSYYEGTAIAALNPVFEYSFPASYDGTTTTLTDLSPAGTHGVVQSTGAYLDGVRPAGFASGGSMHGLLGGRGLTNAIDLLANADIAAAGGYTMDLWARWDNEDLVNGAVPTSQLLSYSGTETIMSVNGSLAATLYLEGNIFEYVMGPVIEVGKWYHIVAEFDTMGSTVNGAGSIFGEMNLWVNGVLENTFSGLVNSVGDDIDRPVGLNTWPGDLNFGGAGLNSTAKLFNPSLYLGVAVPEPTSAGILGVAMVLGLGVRRRHLRSDSNC